ncbi:Holliday junction branch migration protein RuvA [Desulfovirgula thermocuniculi]|uniref:Holliday junction branch migration protein RuvA n=1 Tax=Desulfovirgula thermocuniculi TaxID=348842 RepID=UPI0004218102|nr:Holliday junction branch migration protein RuvA [Desulfovirgula thermocuniculi]
MIAYLCGQLVDVLEEGIVVEAGGIGYLVKVPWPLLRSLPPRGQEIRLYTHLIWKEEGPALYGFGSPADREVFRKLLGVGGIGPRGALAILSVLSPQALQRAVAEENEAVLTAVPGIGKKTARRIILELKDKLPPGQGGVPAGKEEEEAVAALLALGYGEAEARQAVREAAGRLGRRPAEELLRQALRHLGR